MRRLRDIQVAVAARQGREESARIELMISTFRAHLDPEQPVADVVDELLERGFDLNTLEVFAAALRGERPPLPTPLVNAWDDARAAMRTRPRSATGGAVVRAAPAPSRSERLLELVSLALPAQLRDEQVGDALEEIDAQRPRGRAAVALAVAEWCVALGWSSLRVMARRVWSWARRAR